MNNPNDTRAVLGTDSKEMDNKDYYPSNSPYVPKISVADIQLTNVPQSATKIILDGPGGVILKNTELIDKTTQILTRKDGGEIGIGSVNGNVSLSDAQKVKIGLIEGASTVAFSEKPSVLQGYKTIKNMNEFIASDYNNTTQRHFILTNDIDASGVFNYKPVEGKGTLEGLGYNISNLTINTKDEDLPPIAKIGLYSNYEGNIRNINLKNINYDLNAYLLGGLVGNYLGGSVSNVSVEGKIRQGNAVGGIVGSGAWNTEIRNSVNKADISVNTKKYLGQNNVGGIMGEAYDSSLFGVSNFGNISSAKEADYDWGSAVGGILGYSGFESGTPKVAIVGAYNAGKVSGKTVAVEKNTNPEYYDKIYNGLYVGGIVGTAEGSELRLGEVYNNGAIEINYGYKNGQFGKGKIGGVIGTTRGGSTNDVIITSKMTGKKLPVFYVDEEVGYPGDAARATYIGIEASKNTISDYSGIKSMLGVTNEKDIVGRSSGTPGQGGGGNNPVKPDPVKPDPVKPDPVKPDPSDEGIKIPVDYEGVITVVLNEDKDKQREILEQQFINYEKNNVGIYFQTLDSATKKRIQDEALSIINDKDCFAEALDAGKKISKFTNKATDSSIAGFGEKYLAFVRDFYNLHNQREGIAGASDITSLASSSIDLQKEILEIISKMDNNTKSNFFADKSNVKSLGVVSGMLGVISSYMAASDGIDQKRVAVKIADYVDAFDSVVTLNKELEKFVNANKEFHIGKSYLKTGSIWNPLDIYSTVASIGVKSSAQLIKSVDKYSADGKWDLNDTGETMIDTAMVGIKTFSNKLTFGLDDLVFGAIDKTDGKVGYVDQAIQGYKMLANNIGTAIGNWWVDLTYKK